MAYHCRPNDIWPNSKTTAHTWHSCGDHATECRLHRLLATPGQSMTPTGNAGPARAADLTASIAVAVRPHDDKDNSSARRVFRCSMRPCWLYWNGRKREIKLFALVDEAARIFRS